MAVEKVKEYSETPKEVKKKKIKSRFIYFLILTSVELFNSYFCLGGLFLENRIRSSSLQEHTNARPIDENANVTPFCVHSMGFCLNTWVAQQSYGSWVLMG